MEKPKAEEKKKNGKLEFFDFSVLEKKNTAIPIPSAEHILKYQTPSGKSPIGEIIRSDGVRNKESKYEKEYDEYCRWIALPKSERSPATIEAFEKKWGIPRNYTATFFRKQEDFYQRRMNYFWDWAVDHLPDVVEGQLKKAIERKDTNAAKFFADLVAKRIDVEKPRMNISPMLIIGVDQQKIDKLFTPKGYDAIDAIPV